MLFRWKLFSSTRLNFSHSSTKSHLPPIHGRGGSKKTRDIKIEPITWGSKHSWISIFSLTPMFSMLSVDESHLHLRPEQTLKTMIFSYERCCYCNSVTDLVENQMLVNWIATNDLINEFLFWDLNFQSNIPKVYNVMLTWVISYESLAVISWKS